jgi:hypothetical protein
MLIKVKLNLHVFFLLVFLWVISGSSFYLLEGDFLILLHSECAFIVREVKYFAGFYDLMKNDAVFMTIFLL